VCVLHKKMLGASGSGALSRSGPFGRGRLPLFERGQAEFELVDPVPEDFKLGLVGEAAFGAAAQPR